MKIIRHPKKGKLHRPIVALGTFDGVHRGHQKVILAAVKYAKKIGAHSAAITFDPHPQEVIAPERGLRLLTLLKEREELISSLDVDSVVVSVFTRDLRKLTAEQFIQRYLVDRLGVRSVFVGYDYAFGQARTGGIGELKLLGKKYGFTVTVIPPVKIKGEAVKSARIRELISRGDFNRAISLLGHPYRITGRVVRGEGRGTRLGFPTANLQVDKRKLLPLEGVYVGYVGKQKCVVNIGSRPTFSAGPLLVEVHLLGFHGNLRGRELAVDLFRRLRDEKQFSDVLSLQAQIKKDIARARQL